MKTATDNTVEKLRKTARDAQEAIGDIEAAARRRENGPKVGKTYKTRNSYSCPEKRSDYWYLYSVVTRMDDDGYLYTRDFQTDKHGDISIRFDNYAFHMAGHTRIPAAEYWRAWKQIAAKIAAAG